MLGTAHQPSSFAWVTQTTDSKGKMTFWLHRFNIATVQNSAGLGNSAPGISLSTS